MSKFLVLYRAPVAGMDEWMKQDPETRKADEEKMKAEWNTWMSANGANILETSGAGKTKKVTSEGINDVRNDVMLYSVIEAESHDAAASLFLNHPHFGIPGGTIEVMTSNMLPGMQ